MTITVEGGATKTDWVIGGKRFRTPGINLSVMSDRTIFDIVAAAANEVTAAGGGGAPVKLYFYGAGMVSDKDAARMKAILRRAFPMAETECASDLLAAARALWGDCPGIAAILGTGSNSCSYDGVSVTGNVRPGGYILGDEGGGAALGKRFLSDYIKNMVPERTREKFREQWPLDYTDIVNAVYKGENPAGFLSSFAPFIVENASDDAYLHGIVKENLDAFIRRSLMAYGRPGETMKIGVVGSVGYACRQTLMELGAVYGMDFCKFLPSPIDALAAYHSGKQ